MALSQENMNRVMTTFAERVNKLARINLGARRAYTDTDGKRKSKIIDNSGRLRKSLAYDLNVTPNAFSIGFLMEDYGQWVDEGRKKGKGAPLKEIEKWVRSKPIRYRNPGTGSFEKMTESKRKSLAYLINRKIKEKGIAPTKFFTEPFEAEFLKLPNEVIEAYALDVEQFLQFATDRLNNG